MTKLSEMTWFLGVGLNKGRLVSIRNEIGSQYRVPNGSQYRVPNGSQYQGPY